MKRVGRRSVYFYAAGGSKMSSDFVMSASQPIEEAGVFMRNTGFFDRLFRFFVDTNRRDRQFIRIYDAYFRRSFSSCRSDIVKAAKRYV